MWTAHLACSGGNGGARKTPLQQLHLVGQRGHAQWVWPVGEVGGAGPGLEGVVSERAWPGGEGVVSARGRGQEERAWPAREERVGVLSHKAISLENAVLQ